MIVLFVSGSYTRQVHGRHHCGAATPYTLPPSHCCGSLYLNITRGLRGRVKGNNSISARCENYQDDEDDRFSCHFIMLVDSAAHTNLWPPYICKTQRSTWSRHTSFSCSGWVCSSSKNSRLILYVCFFSFSFSSKHQTSTSTVERAQHKFPNKMAVFQVLFSYTRPFAPFLFKLLEAS